MRSVVLSLLSALGLLALPVACSGGDLGIGDPAPPLSIAEWVRGRPVDLAKDVRKKIHVVEFWAVWCPPCKASVPLLTQYQKKYEKDVVIVGVTQPDAQGNTPAAVRRFVSEQGPNMDYTVAIDTGKTTQDYLPAGPVGIPYAFVVGKDGKIVWQGSPLDPKLDEVLGRMVAGTYDVEAAAAEAKLEREVSRRFQELDLLSRLGQWEAVWDGLIDILNLDPANQEMMDILINISIGELKNPEVLESWIRSHIAVHRGNAKAMGRLANVLCSITDLKSRRPALALEAAKAASDATRKPDSWTIAIYARALYQIGDLDRAIALQQDAVAVADGEEKEEHKGILAYYRACKRLQGSFN